VDDFLLPQKFLHVGFVIEDLSMGCYRSTHRPGSDCLLSIVDGDCDWIHGDCLFPGRLFGSQSRLVYLD
jgi:hypothetical protein